jgi:hypothetical protein
LFYKSASRTPSFIPHFCPLYRTFMALIQRPRRFGLPLFRDELDDDPETIRIGLQKMANMGLLNGAMGMPLGYELPLLNCAYRIRMPGMGVGMPPGMMNPGMPLPGMNPGMPGMMQGMNPGMMPGVMPGVMPGMMPGMNPGMMQGMNPGMMQGMNPGMMPGMNPGMMQGMNPGKAA